jgi:hypothetical protein
MKFTPLLRYPHHYNLASLCITAAHYRQSTNFAKGPRKLAFIPASHFRFLKKKSNPCAHLSLAVFVGVRDFDSKEQQTLENLESSLQKPRCQRLHTLMKLKDPLKIWQSSNIWKRQ